MVPRDASSVIRADMELADALPRLAASKIRRALVVADDDRVAGLISMTDAARLFEVLAGEDTGYLGGRPGPRFEGAGTAAPETT